MAKTKADLSLFTEMITWFKQFLVIKTKYFCQKQSGVNKAVYSNSNQCVLSLPKICLNPLKIRSGHHRISPGGSGSD